MRKYVKNRLLEQIKAMQEAHQAAHSLWRSQQSAYEIWMNCQQAAIQIGTVIEQQEGEGTRAVLYLEEYCELVYQLSEEENTGATKNNKKQLLRKIDNKLGLAEQSIKRDISERMEAVFLPYKASMWDALESVWMAANEDECCDAYVIPIPYYDKNQDGSFGQRHYEANLYPDYVPITSYEEYSLEERHPDMIFIHSPYDQYNRITSIDPRFYAKKLREYTEELVYIPYFVSGDSVSERFCVLPGTMYADKVIVENEQVKDIYVQEYEKAVGPGSAQGKFLALGSPKYDKITRMSREDVEIPKEWQNKIKGKKVILYNTTLGGLKEPEKTLDKIENVLHVFKENQDIVLLWRPHPLYYTDLLNINPPCAERYRVIVESYKHENYGIYDDSPDMINAVVVSDAYYGDGGSVPILYRKTGKPVMYQNVDVKIDFE